MVVLVIRKADGVENQVVMDVIPVYVGGQNKLIPAAQDFFCKLHAYFMGLFRRDLPRLKGLDQVATQVRSLVDGMAAGSGKFDIRSLGGTAIGGYKQLPVCLFQVADIVDGRFQRPLDRMRLCNRHISSILSCISRISALYAPPPFLIRVWGLACRLGRRFKAFHALRSPPEIRAPASNFDCSGKGPEQRKIRKRVLTCCAC